MKLCFSRRQPNQTEVKRLTEKVQGFERQLKALVSRSATDGDHYNGMRCVGENNRETKAETTSERKRRLLNLWH